MASTPRFKIAFIGTHGVGKTTLCFAVEMPRPEALDRQPANH